MRDYHSQAACTPSRLRLGALLLPFLLLCSSAGASDGDGGPSSPFSSVEEVFLQGPDGASAKVNLRYITSMPHVAGTTGDHIMADFMVDQFTLLGIPNVSVFDLDVLLNYPADNVPPKLTLFSTSTANNNNSVIFEAKLSEDILDFDDTSDTMWRNHTFHGYGASGNVTAPMVYANYGRPQDFEALEQHAGINVTNKIVLVRYGKCFRGLKVMNAQKRGAVGVLIYSDPMDDGYDVGQVYPKGPWRPESGVQRGSVQFNSKCAGDPMRADSRYSNKNETLESICGVTNYTDLIPKIPSLPISYGDARPLLQHMGGKLAKDVGGDDFVGGIDDVVYRVGPSSDSELQMIVTNREEVRSIPNVIGCIPGTLPVDEDMPVLLGNHRDAWVYGAADPNSGTAALLETARGLGRLLKQGWRPKRSIYLLSWSGEEYGLLGSTGWGELNADMLSRSVAYLNVDVCVSGDKLSVSASPSLGSVWRGVLRDLNGTKHGTKFSNSPLGEIRDANTDWILNQPEIGVLGSGSDFTVFLDHLGIPSLDFSFEKETTYGQYHSIYDSFAWIDAYGGIEGKIGSSFQIIEFASKVWGLLALRLADTEILPLDHLAQGEALLHYVDAIDKQQSGLEMKELYEAVSHYQEAAAKTQVACQSGNQQDAPTCNEKLGLTERQFLSKEGLPHRPWFKHILQAPGMYLGYAAESFPGIQQALDEGDMEVAERQLQVAVERVSSAASFLRLDKTGKE